VARWGFGSAWSQRASHQSAAGSCSCPLFSTNLSPVSLYDSLPLFFFCCCCSFNLRIATSLCSFFATDQTDVQTSHWIQWIVQFDRSLCIIGPIPWGHSGPLCHALSLSSLWTLMRRRRATVQWRHLVNWCEAARCGEWAQHFSNASCYLLVICHNSFFNALFPKYCSFHRIYDCVWPWDVFM